jgi:RimJ/RimL family protein N-acetyltransferase
MEIGWSFLSRKYWGGTYNKAMKTLMIEHAFQSIHKVVFYIGTENVRSQKAVEKLGGLKIASLTYPDIVKNREDTLTYLISKHALSLLVKC